MSILDNDSNLCWGVFLLCWSLVLYKYLNTLKAIVKSKISGACDGLPILVDDR